jgi:thymidylate synthase
MKEQIKQVYQEFLNNSKNSGSSTWQSIKTSQSNPILEQEDLFLRLDIDNPILDLEPDAEWCDIHFSERVSGIPLNPGESYKHWPYYYQNVDNDSLFRASGQFSHTYMERFWPKHAEMPLGEVRQGIRYEYGDLNDVINHLKENPNTRQAFLTIWHPEDQSNMGVRVPCTIGYWFKKSGDKLNVTYLIRSCDIVRHFRNDIYLTWLLLEHVCNKTDIEMGKVSMWIGSLHCFQSDLYYIKKSILKDVWNSNL